MNFTITSNDIVEMKIEPDVILAPSDERREKRALPESSFRMKLDKQRRPEEASSSQCGVPPKKRRHDLTADGGSPSGSGNSSPKSIKEEPVDETDHEGHLTIPVPPILQHSSRTPGSNNLQRSSRLDMLLSKTTGHVAAA